MTAKPHNRRRTGGFLLLAVFLVGVWFVPTAHEALHLHLPGGSCPHSMPAADGRTGENEDRGESRPGHDPDSCRLCTIKAIYLETSPAATTPENANPLPEHPIYFTARPHPGPGTPLHLSRAPPLRQPVAV